MKYLLDTCVVSETRRREPNVNLMNWQAERQAADPFVAKGLQVINPFGE